MSSILQYEQVLQAQLAPQELGLALQVPALPSPFVSECTRYVCGVCVCMWKVCLINGTVQCCSPSAAWHALSMVQKLTILAPCKCALSWKG